MSLLTIILITGWAIAAGAICGMAAVVDDKKASPAAAFLVGYWVTNILLVIGWAIARELFL